MTEYVDGSEIGSGLGAPDVGWLGEQKPHQRLALVFGNAPSDDTLTARLTFCDGRSLIAHALNAERPRVFAAVVNERSFGTPGIQGLDAKGEPVGEALPGAYQYHACTSRSI